MAREITCTELLELSKEHQGATLLDVRTEAEWEQDGKPNGCLLYTSPSPRDRTRSRMPSSA